MITNQVTATAGSGYCSGDLLSGCHILVLIFVILVPRWSVLRKSCYDGWGVGRRVF